MPIKEEKTEAEGKELFKNSRINMHGSAYTKEIWGTVHVLLKFLQTLVKIEYKITF